MTKNQVLRAHRKLWAAITRNNGYQMFGYDLRTLRITNPGFFTARERLVKEYQKATI